MNVVRPVESMIGERSLTAQLLVKILKCPGLVSSRYQDTRLFTTPKLRKTFNTSSILMSAKKARFQTAIFNKIPISNSKVLIYIVTPRRKHEKLFIHGIFNIKNCLQNIQFE